MKLFSVSAAVCMGALFLASCGGPNIEKDVKAMADLECKKLEAKLKKEQNPDDKAAAEAYDKAQEAWKEEGKKMRDKYKDSDKDKEKKVKDLYEKAMESCQAKKDLAAWEEEQDRLEQEEIDKARASMDSLINEANAAVEKLK